MTRDVIRAIAHAAARDAINQTFVLIPLRLFVRLS
jgi:hypothetical protein